MTWVGALLERRGVIINWMERYCSTQEVQHFYTQKKGKAVLFLLLLCSNMSDDEQHGLNGRVCPP